MTVVMASTLCACGHQHTWVEATCTEPKTCSECGETEGEALGHIWVEATKTTPKTCSRCGLTEGTPLAPDPVFFEEYPNLRTPESIDGISFKKQMVKDGRKVYIYSLGSDLDKAKERFAQYGVDVMASDGYVISSYSAVENYYTICRGGNNASNIIGLIQIAKDGSDIVLVIGFLNK